MDSICDVIKSAVSSSTERTEVEGSQRKLAVSFATVEAWHCHVRRVAASTSLGMTRSAMHTQARQTMRVRPMRPLRNMTVMAVALDRLAASFANGVFQRRDRLLLGRRCTGHVEDFFLQNRAVEIVHAVAQRDLRERQSEADPVGSQVVDVIEINPAHREIAKLLKCRGAFDVGENPMRLRRFERKRNKPGKTAGLILQLSQLAQMISPMSERFDVSVKHRAGAAATH